MKPAKKNIGYRLGYRIGRLIKRFVDWKHPKLLKLLYLLPVLAIGLYSIFALLYILALSAIGAAAFYELYKNPTAYGNHKDDGSGFYTDDEGNLHYCSSEYEAGGMTKLID